MTEENIAKIKAANKELSRIVSEAKSIRDRECDSTNITIIEPAIQLEDNIAFNNMVIRISEYILEKEKENKNCFNWGKYLQWSFYPLMEPNDLCFELFLNTSSDIVGKLYDIFESYSTINGIAQNIISTAISAIIGGNDNLSYISKFFKKRCGKRYTINNDYKIMAAYRVDDYKKDIEEAKNLIDYVIKLSTNKKLMKDIDDLLDHYFDLIFKNNKEEDE